MVTTVAQIDTWRATRSEHQNLEFKEAKTQFDYRRLCKYCGQLLLGIADRPPRNVVGTAACQDPVGMAAKLFQSLGFRVDIEEVAHPDGRVVVEKSSWQIRVRLQPAIERISPTGRSSCFRAKRLCRSEWA